jgi:2-iminobutanoate/2-iminopropanoate deaminase
MSRSVIVSDQLPSLTRPYSYGVKAGGWIFTAGLLGVDAAGKVVGTTPGAPDVDAQTRQALGHLKTVLATLGSSVDRVAKVKSYLTDFRLFDGYNEAYRSFLKPPYPARATVGARLLRPNAVIEVEAIATVSGSPREIRSPRLAEAGSPVAQGATQVGDVLFVTGQIPHDAKGQLVGRGDMRIQAEQVLDNVGTVLEAAGFTFRDVIKINGTVPDWYGFNRYNEIFVKYFSEPYEARATIQGDLAGEGMLLEVEAVAARGRRRVVESAVAGVAHFSLKRREDTVYVGELPGAMAPHSHAVQVGDLIHLCGEIGYDASGRLVGPGDIRAQTRKTMENLALCMGALGGTLDDIVKTNVSITDYRMFEAFNEEYARFLSPPYPARTTVVGGLAQERMVVEIEAIAVLGASRDAVVVTGPQR